MPRWTMPMLVSVAIIVLCGIGVVFLDRGVSMHGVGGTNLNIEFIVEDRDTKEPIPNARVEIRSHGGCYVGAEDDIGLFELKTDAAGTANRVCRGAWFTESCSTLGLRRTYKVRIPLWQVRAHAEVYADSIWTDLHEEYHGKVQHNGPQQDSLQVRMSLIKAHAPE